jgi:predicted DNA-binding transcriptional regulator AlpA
MSTEDLIPVRDVAKLLTVSKPTAERLIKANPDFPKAFRLSPTIVKYSKAAVLEWLRSKQEQ